MASRLQIMESPELELKTSVSLIVPTYREVENIPELIERVDAIRRHFDEFELLIVDDNSRDGTEALIEKMHLPWVRLIVRTQDRGLSQSVVEGLKNAKHEFLVVMDADLSHPPEVIPEMVQQSRSADLVIGSRYVKGGELDEAWTAFRWVNSKVATLLARPFTSAKDPMSGFFSLRKSIFERAESLNPIGYKIGLEVIVKCKCKEVREVPIHFADRKHGQSKLNLKEQLSYLRHIKRLADFKFGHLSFALQFLVVGISGTLVNILCVTFFDALGFRAMVSITLGIFISMTTNFLLNRSLTFTYAKNRSFLQQYGNYALASSIGILVNYVVAYQMLEKFPQLNSYPQIPALFGIAAGVIFNFITARFWVFRHSATKGS